MINKNVPRFFGKDGIVCWVQAILKLIDCQDTMFFAITLRVFVWIALRYIGSLSHLPRDFRPVNNQNISNLGQK